MTITTQAAAVVAQIVPVFLVLVLFDRVQFRRDIPTPRRYAVSVVWMYRLGGYVLAVLLLMSMWSVLTAEPISAGYDVLYVVFCGAGFLLLMGVLVARGEALKDMAANEPEHGDQPDGDHERHA